MNQPRVSARVLRAASALIAVGSALSLSAAPLSAFAASSVAITSLEPGSSIPINSTVTFTVAANGFTNPTYSLFDSYSGGSIESSDLNASGQFSWTPLQNDVGTHSLVVNVADSLGDVGSATLSITVGSSNAAAQVSINSLYPSANVIAGETVSFTADTAGFAGTPDYTLADSFSPSTIAQDDISAAGAFSWTPAASDIGTHVITLSARDAAGNTANTSVTMSVSAPPGGIASTASTAVTDTSTATPAQSFTEYLTPGSQDDEVSALQQLLTAQGDFSGPITGYFGSLTENAVIAFQAAHGLDQLGVVGPATRAALNALESTVAQAGTAVANVASTATDTGSTVTLAQVEAEVQSLTAILTQVESQLAALVGH